MKKLMQDIAMGKPKSEWSLKGMINLNLICDFLKQNNLTKEEFAEKYDISKDEINKVFNEKNFLLETLQKVADAMDLTIIELFNF